MSRGCVPCNARRPCVTRLARASGTTPDAHPGAHPTKACGKSRIRCVGAGFVPACVPCALGSHCRSRVSRASRVGAHYSRWDSSGSHGAPCPIVPFSTPILHPGKCVHFPSPWLSASSPSPPRTRLPRPASPTAHRSHCTPVGCEHAHGFPSPRDTRRHSPGRGGGQPTTVVQSPSRVTRVVRSTRLGPLPPCTLLCPMVVWYHGKDDGTGG